TDFGGDAVTGNVLEVHTRGLEFKNVKNFAEYDFLLPPDTENGDMILSLTGPNGTVLGDAKVGVAMQGGGHLLQEGDRVALVHNPNGVDSSGVTQKKLTGYQGVSVKYKFELDRDDDNLYAVTQAAPPPDEGSDDSGGS